jgi:hypothetical protein
MPRWTNGHKTFTAAEARAMYEIQMHEKDRAKNFERNKDSLVAQRNPLTGQATPRIGEEQNLMATYDMTRTHEFVDKTFLVADKIGLDLTSSSTDRMLSSTTSIRSRRDAIKAELEKANELASMREAKVMASFYRNRELCDV